MKLNAYGRELIIERRAHGWCAFHPGSEGKRRPADFTIPSDLSRADIPRYIADLLHEWATPAHPAVEEID